MEHPLPPDQLGHLSATTACVYAALFLYGLYYCLAYLDYPVLSPQELFWNTLVYVIPAPLLLDPARRQELEANNMLSQTHAAKGDALRRIMGLGGSAIMSNLPNTGEAIGMSSMMRRVSTSVSTSKGSEVPAGLGNWDNSCYQNSVLQALSSSASLMRWLSVSEPAEADGGSTTNTALQEMIAELRDPSNNGRHIWTPAKLKNMSSWQQQDAQEYFSKVMDELEKDAKKAFEAKEVKLGLEAIVEMEERDTDEPKKEDIGEPISTIPHNPLEGLVAQRVSCTKCGFSEGYSMIPFNCLTVPLGSNHTYDLSDCLDEYTRSEDIEGVECRSCTLLQTRTKLQHLQLPPELRGQIAQRLHAIEQALETDDYSDKTLKQDCLIPAKAYVSSTKTKEAVIGRAPKSLVVHVNRSVFDPITGVQRKNYAQVRYPLLLDLRPWMLGLGDTAASYRLSAVVTHYGRHENGHYICYRRHPKPEPDSDKEVDGEEQEPWWRLSDEDVSPVSEQDVLLQQGGVFMLFYERLDETREPQPLEALTEAAAIPLPPDEATDWEMLGLETSSTATPSLITSSTQSVVSESDTDYDGEPDPLPLPVAEPKVPAAAPILKTAVPAYTFPTQKDMKHELGMNRSMMSV